MLLPYLLDYLQRLASIVRGLLLDRLIGMTKLTPRKLVEHAK